MGDVMGCGQWRVHFPSRFGFASLLMAVQELCRRGAGVAVVLFVKPCYSPVAVQVMPCRPVTAMSSGRGCSLFGDATVTIAVA